MKSLKGHIHEIFGLENMVGGIGSDALVLWVVGVDSVGGTEV